MAVATPTCEGGGATCTQYKVQSAAVAVLFLPSLCCAVPTSSSVTALLYWCVSACCVFLTRLSFTTGVYVFQGNPFEQKGPLIVGSKTLAPLVDGVPVHTECESVYCFPSLGWPHL